MYIHNKGTASDFVRAINGLKKIPSIENAYIAKNARTFVTLDSVNLSGSEIEYKWTLHYINPETAYTSKGYKLVTIFGRKYALHRLIAETYIPRPPHAMQVIHKDGDKTNNKASNLDWR